MMESSRRLLPMQGHTRGNRSAATCHYKCGDACAQPPLNTSDNAYFKDIADAALSRRKVLGLGALGAAALVVGPDLLAAPAAQAGTATATAGSGKLPFTAIGPVSRSVDTMSVPQGYDWRAIIRWGDPLVSHSPNFEAAHQSARAQSQQFGYNCDYLDILSDGENGNTGCWWPTTNTPTKR